MHIELEPDDLEEIRMVLTERLHELRQEVVHADVSTFRDRLKARERKLKRILRHLEVPEEITSLQ